MDELIAFFRKNKGYARMKDLKASGFQTKAIKEYYERGIIDKIKPGLYRINRELTEKTLLIDVCQAIPKAVIFLASALHYYQLTTFSPPILQIAVPESYKAPKIMYPRVEVFHLRERIFRAGILVKEFNEGAFRIYSQAKSVCDSFKFRNRMGEDIAIESLKEYLNRNNYNTSELREYMTITRTKTVMSPYIKAVINS